MSESKSGLPIISILIPVFNRKDFIAECIQSALSQTFSNFELVVVDNASDDGTWDIARQFAARDGRVRVFRNDLNIGPVRNWKRCADEAVGQFSKILFSDDCLEPECLSEMLPKLDDPSIALVYCAARIGEARETAVLAYSNDECSRMTASQFVTHIWRDEAPVSPGAILIRTNDLRNSLQLEFPTSTPRPFAKHGAGPDVMIALLTSEKYSHVAHISRPLVFFREHLGSFSSQNANGQVADGYRSAISYYLKKSHGREVWLDYLAFSWLLQIRRSRRWRNPLAFLREYEGNGSIGEILTMVSCSFRHLLRIASTRIARKRDFTK